jgi:hypothetical protein
LYAETKHTQTDLQTYSGKVETHQQTPEKATAICTFQDIHP